MRDPNKSDDNRRPEADWDAVLAKAVRFPLSDGKVRFMLREQDLPPGFSLPEGQIAPGVRVSYISPGDEIAPGFYALGRPENFLRRAVKLARQVVRAVRQWRAK